MTILGMPQEITSYITGYLTVKDYLQFGATCKTLHQVCMNQDKSVTYFKKVYQQDYSAVPLQPDSQSNPWRDQIIQVETKIRSQTLFSKKFKACVSSSCEKLGSLKRVITEINQEVLTTCLRDLVNDESDNPLVLLFAKQLIDAGAAPLNYTDPYMKDSPLRLAVLESKPKLVSFFLKHLPNTPKNRQKIQKFIKQLKENPIEGVNTSQLEQFLKS